MLTIRLMILKSNFTNSNIIAKYNVLSNIISVVSDNILRICIQEPLLISKKNIVLLHTVSAYDSLLVRYKVYLSDPRECLCTSWRYTKADENFSINPAPCRKDSIKKKNYHIKLSAPITKRKLQWNKIVIAKVCLIWSLLLRKLTLKSVTAKVSLENLVWNVLKESKLWNRTFKSAVW